MKVGLEGCISLLEATKWKFYEVQDTCVRVEVPKDRETLVVELPYGSPEALARIKARLNDEGFTEQEIRPWRAG